MKTKQKQKLCKYCKSVIYDLEVCEVTIKRMESIFRNNKLSRGDELVVMREKRFKCPTCKHTLTKNPLLAKKMISKGL